MLKARRAGKITSDFAATRAQGTTVVATVDAPGDSDRPHPQAVPADLDLRLVAGRSWAIARRREIADRGRP